MSDSPSLRVTVRVDYSKHQSMIKCLDKEAAKFNLQRLSASPGIQELANRKVFFMRIT